MQSDTACLRALLCLFNKLDLDASVEHFERFDEWVQQLSNLELSALIESLSRKLTRRFEKQ